MGPTKKSKAVVSDPSSSKQHASQSEKNSKGRKRPQHKKHPAPSTPDSSSSNVLPGVQKIKAALRQTRRLLAKDTLAADVRVATERRLKALEADLARAEQARLERTLATRYHKVKFFERQKIARRIAQIAKQLAADPEKKERRKLEARLQELRVDLNYVLHYPKTKKYISLFPPEVRQGGKDKDKEQVAREEKEKSETDRQREEVRKWVREQMEAGALSAEPEVELTADAKRAAAAAQDTFVQDGVRDKRTKGGNAKSIGKAAGNAVADDDFFAKDEEADSEENEEGDSPGEDSEEDSDMDED
ncbi:hypothetical protein L226DRAFT_540154 [Lentinus tigrinus ALCF2SS1-7]|nr:hypothetical protein L226DRAFT_540154 [Lentinus tigrinus ALCF2SS1-7]